MLQVLQPKYIRSMGKGTKKRGVNSIWESQEIFIKEVLNWFYPGRIELGKVFNTEGAA